MKLINLLISKGGLLFYFVAFAGIFIKSKIMIFSGLILGTIFVYVKAGKESYPIPLSEKERKKMESFSRRTEISKTLDVSAQISLLVFVILAIMYWSWLFLVTGMVLSTLMGLMARKLEKEYMGDYQG